MFAPWVLHLASHVYLAWSRNYCWTVCPWVLICRCQSHLPMFHTNVTVVQTNGSKQTNINVSFSVQMFKQVHISTATAAVKNARKWALICNLSLSWEAEVKLVGFTVTLKGRAKLCEEAVTKSVDLLEFFIFTNRNGKNFTNLSHKLTTSISTFENKNYTFLCTIFLKMCCKPMQRTLNVNPSAIDLLTSWSGKLSKPTCPCNANDRIFACCCCCCCNMPYAHIQRHQCWRQRHRQHTKMLSSMRPFTGYHQCVQF